MAKKIVTIVGALGIQGGSVVAALLTEGVYSIRAITRNPGSDNAKSLAAKGIDVVKADANDPASLKTAFEGSYAIYAVTDFFEPFGQHGPEKAVEIETEQGVNLAKAAASTSTLEHYIWSTLPNGMKISGGKYFIPHFEAKNRVDDYIKSNASLLAKTTFLWVTFYATNYYFPMFTPIHVPTAGKHIQIQVVPPNVPINTIGDARKNVGAFVRAILANPEKTVHGKFVLASTEETTAGAMLQTWGKAQDKQTQYVQVDERAYNALWPMWAEEIAVMMQFWENAGNKSWSGEKEILTKDDLGVKEPLLDLEQSFADVKI